MLWEGILKIGIISDTHGLLRPAVLDTLSECEVILHGGDINNQGILNTLADIAPVYAVRGNNDKEWAEGLPLSHNMTRSSEFLFGSHTRSQTDPYR